MTWDFLCPSGLVGLHTVIDMPPHFHAHYLWHSSNRLTVSLNSVDAIKEAFLKSEDFADRGVFGEISGLQDRE